jgi:putative thiamine transport system substrate-binding protein
MASLRALLLCLAVLVLGLTSTRAEDVGKWDRILAEARGQTVYWHAWGGEQSINDYIAWAGVEVKKHFGVSVEHVKLTDTAEAVAKVVAEKAAGRSSDGSVDLVWINGANFAAMKEQGLLYGPWAEDLPNYKLVDSERKAALTRDFTVPTEGFEAPWDMAQVVFFYDTAKVKKPPRNIRAILDYAQAYPGRIAYPDAQNFLGATFLKQALIGLVGDPGRLQKPAEDSDFNEVTAPLWGWLDSLHNSLWRQGRAFPANSAELRQLLADGEIDIAFSFNPSEASLAIANGELPDTVRSYVLDRGTIGNASFVAIPFNAAAKQGAMVLADFLLSPEAQARKQDPGVWGGFTVLALDKLKPEDRKRFEQLELGVATLSPAELGTALSEPHPSWMTRITREWLKRYASQ